MITTDAKLVVRLTQAEKRNIKTLAASQGLTMREAIMQAFEAWAFQFASGTLPAGPKVEETTPARVCLGRAAGPAR